MTRSIKFRTIVILAILGASLWYLYPTYHLSRMSPEETKRMSLTDSEKLDAYQKKSIKLGLDLQGGMHIVLELDDSEMKLNDEDKTDAVDRALEIIRTRVDQFGVSEPLIQKAGDDRIIVELAGVVDTARARELVEQSAFLEFKLVKPQVEFIEAVDAIDKFIVENNLQVIPDAALESLSKENSQEEKKDESFDPTELFSDKETISAESDSTSETEMASDDSSDQIEDVVKEAATGDNMSKKPFSSLVTYDQALAGQALERRESELLVPLRNIALVKEYLSIPEIQDKFAMLEVDNEVDYLSYRSPEEDDVPDTLEVLWGDDDTNMIWPDGSEYKRLFLVKKSPEMTGDYLSDANATIGGGYDPRTANQPLVLMQMDGDGADLFEEITGKYVQRDVAIVLDKIVKFAPRVQGRIPGGRAQIEGVPSMEKARDLAIVLRAGQLPTPLKIVESRTIGPSLGADSIRKGSTAAVIGFGIVVLFMLVYYKVGGLVANVALFFDMLIILAVLAGFNATLTLPGIAGMILTIGMAVDANVLIFERIREELKTGKSLRAAIDTGYDKAFSTILDANITTFITAIVLFQFGTGPIKGFAVTLSIGLATSMFTAIYVTRVVFDIWTNRKSVKSIAL